MAEFCNCGSLMLKGSCTNKKCRNHNSRISPASFDQIEYLKDLIEKAGKDESDYNLKEMTKDDADKHINELLEELELAE